MRKMSEEERAHYWAWMKARVETLWRGRGKGPTKKQCWYRAQQDWLELRRQERRLEREAACTVRRQGAVE
jgi:hypothetical protein